jgi:pilus assembly protein Flp/PilA
MRGALIAPLYSVKWGVLRTRRAESIGKSCFLDTRIAQCDYQTLASERKGEFWFTGFRRGRHLRNTLEITLMSEHPLVMWFNARLNVRTERGAAAVEYALLVALIAVVIIGAVTVLGGTMRTKFNFIVTKLGGTASPD